MGIKNAQQLLSMNTFKLSSKTIHTDERSSIENKHNKTILMYEEYYSTLPEKTKELKSIECVLPYVKSVIEKNKIISKINTLQDEIYEIETQKDLMDYMLNSLEFIENIGEKNFVKNENEYSSGILQFINVEGRYNNGTVYNEYLMKCFPNENNNTRPCNVNKFLCKHCDTLLINDSSSGFMFCETCGITEKITISSVTEWGAHETHDMTKAFSYKRINHFKEWISQLQGKETTVIPSTVTDLLLIEIKKERITNPNNITFEKIKGFLRKLKLNKYYEHIPNIIHALTNNPQLKINDKLEKQLLILFEKIQKPFMKHCPKDRKNFLSYSYTLYKFCQVLDKEEYLVYFPLLKSRQKLFEQESIWKNICKELDWVFIPCI